MSFYEHFNVHYYKYKQHATVNTTLLFRVHPSVKIKPHASCFLNIEMIDINLWLSIFILVQGLFLLLLLTWALVITYVCFLVFFARIYLFIFSLTKICSYFMETLNCKVILFIYFLFFWKRLVPSWVWYLRFCYIVAPLFVFLQFFIFTLQLMNPAITEED